MSLFIGSLSTTNWDTFQSMVVLLLFLSVRELISYLNGRRKERKHEEQEEKHQREVLKAESDRITAEVAAKKAVEAAMYAVSQATIAAKAVVTTTATTARITDEASKDTKARLKQIHILVNSRLTAALKKISELTTKVALLSPGDREAQIEADQARQKSEDKGLNDKESQDDLFVEDFEEEVEDEPRP